MLEDTAGDPEIQPLGSQNSDREMRLQADRAGTKAFKG
jgi:hypothetical protein